MSNRPLPQAQTPPQTIPGDKPICMMTLGKLRDLDVSHLSAALQMLNTRTIHRTRPKKQRLSKFSSHTTSTGKRSGRSSGPTRKGNGRRSPNSPVNSANWSVLSSIPRVYGPPDGRSWAVGSISPTCGMKNTCGWPISTALKHALARKHM